MGNCTITDSVGDCIISEIKQAIAATQTFSPLDTKALVINGVSATALAIAGGALTRRYTSLPVKLALPFGTALAMGGVNAGLETYKQRGNADYNWGTIGNQFWIGAGEGFAIGFGVLLGNKWLGKEASVAQRIFVGGTLDGALAGSISSGTRSWVETEDGVRTAYALAGGLGLGAVGGSIFFGAGHLGGNFLRSRALSRLTTDQLIADGSDEAIRALFKKGRSPLSPQELARVMEANPLAFATDEGAMVARRLTQGIPLTDDQIRTILPKLIEQMEEHRLAIYLPRKGIRDLFYRSTRTNQDAVQESRVLQRGLDFVVSTAQNPNLIDDLNLPGLGESLRLAQWVAPDRYRLPLIRGYVVNRPIFATEVAANRSIFDIKKGDEFKVVWNVLDKPRQHNLLEGWNTDRLLSRPEGHPYAPANIAVIGKIESAQKIWKDFLGEKITGPWLRVLEGYNQVLRSTDPSRVRLALSFKARAEQMPNSWEAFFWRKIKSELEIS